jgi:uncharacterized protein (TIGR03000 family)
MFRNTLSFSLAVLSAGAMLLAAPDTSHAQRGGRVGGVRFGGARVGGFRPGSFIGRGFPRGAFRGGNYFYRGSNGYYGGYYPNFSSYGYYGGYPYNAAYYPNYGGSVSGYQGSNYNPGYYNSYLPDFNGGTTQPYGSYDTNTPLETSENSAVISVHVPLALADVAFDGKLTTSTGKDRVFTTPELTPGKTYTYTVTANWTDGGVARDETRTVQVQAGQRSTVDFSKKQE